MEDVRAIGSAAESLFKNAAFKKACERLEERYSKDWRTSDLHQSTQREQAYLRLRALTDLLQLLRSFIEAGQAEAIVDAKKEAKAVE